MDALASKQAAGSTWLDNTASDENELFSRLNADPLYAMQKSLKRDREKQVLQNPLAMKRIKASLAEELRAFEQERLMKKAAKKAKKDAKKKKKKSKKEKKRARSPSSSPSPPPPRRPPAGDGYGLRKGERAAAADRDDAALGPSRDLVAAREREQAARRFRPEKVNLSDEEKARRLAEFASDGAAHDGRRAERLKHHRGNEAKDSIAEDDAELARRAASRQGHDAAFLRDTRARAYVGSETTLADNVGRNRNRLDRRSRGDDA